MRNSLLASALLSLSAVFASSQPGNTQDLIELGKLECFVDGGTGLVIGSTKDLSCVFTSNKADWGEDNYFGVIKKFGLDIGKTEETKITWLVVAAALEDYAPGFLAGDYIGASASASVAIGLGANALVGGSNKQVALQPFSIEEQKGLNLAVGVTGIELRSVATE